MDDSARLLREELAAALHRAGLTTIQWFEPETSGFFQPIDIARKP